MYPSISVFPFPETHVVAKWLVNKGYPSPKPENLPTIIGALLGQFSANPDVLCSLCLMVLRIYSLAHINNSIRHIAV